MVPYVFFGALAGALIDRVDKRLLLIWCDVASATLMAAVPLCMAVSVGVTYLSPLRAYDIREAERGIEDAEGPAEVEPTAAD